MPAPGAEAKRRREEDRKRREIVKGIVEFLTPTIKNMEIWEIEDLLRHVGSVIQSKFHPFRTFGQAMEYKKDKIGKAGK